MKAGERQRVGDLDIVLDTCTSNCLYSSWGVCPSINDIPAPGSGTSPIALSRHPFTPQHE